MVVNVNSGVVVFLKLKCIENIGIILGLLKSGRIFEVVLVLRWSLSEVPLYYIKFLYGRPNSSGDRKPHTP